MNYLPWVSNAVYGATDATERANFFASWGIMESLVIASVSGLKLKLKQLVTHIPYLFKLTTKHLQ